RQQHVGHDETENAVAQEFEAFVVDASMGRARAGMGQRALQTLAVGEGVAGALVKRFGEGICGQTLGGRHDLSGRDGTSVRRASATATSRFPMGLPSAIEKKMTLARPTRF